MRGMTAQPAPLEQRPWYHRRACQDVDPDVFFPPKGASTRPAKRICNQSCPVRLECLEYALETGERFGVWGGLSERERRALAGFRKAEGKGWRASQTHCKKGHPFAGDNLRVEARGRVCRACQADRERIRRQRGAS